MHFHYYTATTQIQSQSVLQPQLKYTAKVFYITICKLLCFFA